MAADERPHAILLAHRLIEFVESIAELTPLQRDAAVSSLESGSLIRDVESALIGARQREREQSEHPTPIVDVCDRDVTAIEGDGGQPGNTRPREYARPTLPTVPPGTEHDVPTRKLRSITQRGGFRTD